ncbi:Protein N-acetyltransferase, RimJ/RimL family [Cnuella takakiae]|uniref:Protein N-acetyltransferase, RimJ/RimL family n=2 Tax=Cnuella takakiae TaxID=1302690 RepID=A0A1M4X9E0_9BACT|nr:GNAT family N-acetyltransferase [Cnuella takakiae]SHE90036.1 Protein N-acetyltransferase, RimJ/RimL family [Cnuella takakiae]
MSFTHTNQDIVLENERVLLRSLEAADVQHLLPFSLYEPELWLYSLTTAASESNLRQYITTALEARAAGRELPFIVFDKKQNRYAGATRFYDIQLAQQNTQLGYTWYGKAFQGTGLNRHCKFLLLQFAFETMGMMRVEFRADARNARSIAAMKAIGCVPEGVLRSNGFRADGSRRDSMILSILKGEWEAGVKELLLGKLQ